MYLDQPQADFQSAGVFGRDIVVDEWLAALLTHGGAGAYRFFQQRDRLNARPLPGHPALEALARSRSDIDMAIDDIAELPRALGEPGVRLWHDVDGDMHVAIAARSRFAARLYPVTATTHVLSYRSLRHGWFLRMMLQDVQRCDSLICTSWAARTATERLIASIAERIARDHGVALAYRGRLDVLPLGVDTERFSPAPKSEIRRMVGLPQEAFLIGWIGRLSMADKADLLPLVTVFARLVRANAGRELGLVIAGSGERSASKMIMHHASTLGVAESIHMIDPLPPESRHAAYAALDVFVSPAENIQETFGITPIEAMASGVPQVVADWDGYRDTVVNGETGFLIPTAWSDDDGDATAWAALGDAEDFVDHLLLAQATSVDLGVFEQALQLLLDDDALRARMSEASRRRALAIYAWPRIIARYESLWTELVAEAAHTTWSRARDADYAAPRFVEAFGHYATRLLTAETVVSLTAAGRTVLEGEEKLPAYLVPTRLWSPATFARVLTLIARDGPAVTLGEIDAACSSADSNGSARRHAMWLLKYGFITDRDGASHRLRP